MSKQLGKRLDKTVRALARGSRFEEFNLIHMTNLWLAASFAYYERDDPFMGDGLFDSLTKYLLERHGDLKDAGVWHVDEFFPVDALEAGTGYHLHGKYPTVIQDCVFDIRRVGDGLDL
mgnify:CR=1 FL=1